jgi:hypothetical protein
MKPRVPPTTDPPPALPASPGYSYNAYRSVYVSEAMAEARDSGWHAYAGDELAANRPPQAVAPPTASERALMVSLHIDFDGHAFRFGGYAYSRLADAVSYARMAAGPD